MVKATQRKMNNLTWFLLTGTTSIIGITGWISLEMGINWINTVLLIVGLIQLLILSIEK